MTIKINLKIQTAAIKYASYKGNRENSIAHNAFVAGANWQLENSEWNDVNELLPENNIKVLVWGEQGGMNPSMGGAYAFIAYRIETNKNISKELRHKIDVNGFLNVHYVTHWLPLPTRL